jgi:hypothetical protein
MGRSDRLGETGATTQVNNPTCVSAAIVRRAILEFVRGRLCRNRRAHSAYRLQRVPGRKAIDFVSGTEVSSDPDKKSCITEVIAEAYHGFLSTGQQSLCAAHAVYQLASERPVFHFHEPLQVGAFHAEMLANVRDSRRIRLLVLLRYDAAAEHAGFGNHKGIGNWLSL